MSRGNQRTHAEKVAVVSRVLAGEAKASVSRSTGVPESTLRGWVKDERIVADALRRQSQIQSTSVIESAFSTSDRPLSASSASTSKVDRTRGVVIKRFVKPVGVNRRFSKTPKKIVVCGNGKKLYRVIEVIKEETVVQSNSKSASQNFDMDCYRLLQTHPSLLNNWCSAGPSQLVLSTG